MTGGPNLDLPNYEYDGARNISRIAGDSFSYDSLNRLVRANLGTDGVRDYTYDRYGNLTSIDGEADRPGPVSSVTNRLTNPSFNYDEAGNLVAGFGGTSRAFDPFNMVYGEAGTGIQRQMLYTAGDERVSVIDIENDEERWTLRNPSHQVLRTISRDLDSGAFTWKRDNIFRERSLLAAAVSDGAGGEDTFHFHLDHLGTTRLKTDGAGNPRRLLQVLALRRAHRLHPHRRRRHPPLHRSRAGLRLRRNGPRILRIHRRPRQPRLHARQVLLAVGGEVSECGSGSRQSESSAELESLQLYAQ